MYKTEDGKKKFSFTRFIWNTVPNLAGAPQDTDLSTQEEDLAFLHQLSEPEPLVLSADVFAHAGVTSETRISASIHKALIKNGVLEQGSPAVHTDKITKHFANQVPEITSHAQKKLINFLFFWEEEGQRWRKLQGEQEELKVVIAEEKGSGGNVGTYEKRLAEVEGEMQLRPSMRSRQAQENTQLPGEFSPIYQLASILRAPFIGTMTKDWDSVQDEIKELSFNQKRSLEDVKELMERKHKFRASTRAYRMKLKEWGLMRHQRRKARPQTDRTDSIEREVSNGQSENSPGSAEPMSVDSGSLDHRTRIGGWQITPNLQPSVEVPSWMKEIPVVPDSVQDMLQCILDRDSEKLEALLMEHVDDVNRPVGLPFEPSNGRFAKHQALGQMVLMQHPNQTLLDIASGMPNGPSVWVLVTYGAQGSTHPLGFDLALHNAIRNGRQYNVQALCISDRSDVNGLDESSWKPLLQAVSWTGPEVVSILLKRGARVDDLGSSPFDSGTYTALQLCLELIAKEYHNETVRSRCNDNSKLLLKAGAGIHVLSPRGITTSLFEKFIEPWRGCEHWFMNLSVSDMDCLNLFVEMGADLSAKFSGCPCAADSSDTFAHQALWHSPPCLSRRVVSSYSHENPTSGTLLLHEVLEKCAAANRHCAEALEDIETLLARGVNPNTLDNRGMTPLRRCIEHSPAVDVLAMTQKLLDGGADPEFEDIEEMQPYAIAALELPDPMRHEVLQAMLTKMQGQGTCTRDDRTYRWEAGLFPIPESPSYQQVLSCTQPDGDFRLSMQ
ncbi:hypothetical protein E8E13_002701 [Curvularia kusanoi]|uniref:Clr5 domain-containing protein n=1 Tax=Curvularia kusanoi TaxID=90978 RepID=A0A9P4TLW9_CURKU|nr:hypothetical protein E8E13_002701 [Curvularia kusanoi]